jgi:hypothetical protein
MAVHFPPHAELLGNNSQADQRNDHKHVSGHTNRAVEHDTLLILQGRTRSSRAERAYAPALSRAIRVSPEDWPRKSYGLSGSAAVAGHRSLLNRIALCIAPSSARHNRHTTEHGPIRKAAGRCGSVPRIKITGPNAAWCDARQGRHGPPPGGGPQSETAGTPTISPVRHALSFCPIVRLGGPRADDGPHAVAGRPHFGAGGGA